MVTHSNKLPIQLLRVWAKPPLRIVRCGVRPEDGAAVVDDSGVDAKLGLYIKLAPKSIQASIWTCLPLVRSTGRPP
jgi:hypothetical protein